MCCNLCICRHPVCQQVDTSSSVDCSKPKYISVVLLFAAAPLGYVDPFADPYGEEAAPDRFLLLLDDQEAGGGEDGMDVSTDHADAQGNQVTFCVSR